MLELIFAWIGAGVSVVFVLSVFSWLWIVYNKKSSIRYHEVRDAKLKEYDELAREINRQANILMLADWIENYNSDGGDILDVAIQYVLKDFVNTDAYWVVRNDTLKYGAYGAYDTLLHNAIRYGYRIEGE